MLKLLYLLLIFSFGFANGDLEIVSQYISKEGKVFVIDGAIPGPIGNMFMSYFSK